MLAFHNNQAIKDKYLTRVRTHAVADEIIKGKYWEGGKGCAVGCTVHSGNHSDYEKELGIPVFLARLEDFIFEHLPNNLAKIWPIIFLEAIHVGADLDLIWPKFAHWLLVDPDYGMMRFNPSDAILNIAKLFERRIGGNNPSMAEWNSAARAADAVAEAAYATARAADAAYAAARAADAAYAAARAAYAAARAAAAYAADASYNADGSYNAADAYAYAYAAYAAYAADYADYADYAADASYNNFVIIMSEKLLDLLRSEHSI